MNKWINGGLVLVIIFALLAAGYNAWQRHSLERDYRDMEIAVVYEEAEEIASIDGEADTQSFLEGLKQRGVTTVLFKEDTPETLEEKGQFHVGTGTEMNNIYGLKPAFPDGEYKPHYTYLVAEEKESMERVAGIMNAKDISFQTAETGSGMYVLGTPLTEGDLKSGGLGFPLKEMEQAAGEGFNIMVQPRTWHGVSVDGLEAVFQQFGEVEGALSGVLFNDNKVPGYVQDVNERKVYLRALGEEIEKLGVPLVEIEFEDQKGFDSVARAMDKNVVRLHTISRDEMDEYGVKGAIDRYELAATDRNARVLLVRFFESREYNGLINKNLDFFEKLENTMVQEQGFTLGRASSPGSLNVPGWSVFVIGLGVIAGGVLLAQQLLPRKWALALGMLGVLVWIGITALALNNASLLIMARKLAALAAVIIFPSLAVIRGVGERGFAPGGALLRFLKLSILSLAGAALMVGLLSDTSFMVKLDQFRGVKIAMAAPLALAGVYFFFAVPRGIDWKEKILRAVNYPVTVGGAALAVIILGVLLLYLIRSGNAGAVLPFEAAFRGYLEELLGARPRTKEFLLGHPVLLLLLYTGYRNIRYMPLLLLGTIGQVSMVNTFAHIHTPLAVSLLRSFNGLWLGILLGVVLIVLWHFIMKYGKRLLE